MPLGPWAAAATETRARKDKACRLADAAIQLVRRPPPAGGKQVAWRICLNVLTHALDYDSRVLTSSLVLPHATVIEERVWDLLQAVIGHPLTDQQREQVELPTRKGGCQMPMPTRLVPMVRAADIMESGLALRTAVVSWGYSLETARSVDGVEEAVQDDVFAQLQNRGVALSSSRKPVAYGHASAAAANAELLRPSAPSRHTLSAFLKVCAEQKFEDLFRHADSRSRTSMLSAGGPTAGKSLVAPAGLQQAHHNDEDFTEILQWRLGSATPGEAHRCQNVAARTGEMCGEELRQYEDHAAICPCGPTRNRRHEDLADCLAQCVEETGAHVRRDAFVRALSTRQREAWLDVWAFGGLRVRDLLVDVTVRHPVADRYQPAAAREAGATAADAAKEKLEKYPARAGRTVTPFALETWGRMDRTAEDLLQTLAAAATQQARWHGQAATASATLRRWRASIDACLQRGVARERIAARCGLAGRPLRRTRGPRGGRTSHSGEVHA